MCKYILKHLKKNFWSCKSVFKWNVLVLFLYSLLLQEEIDIFEGVKDIQAMRLAENLGFKGNLQQQVIFNPDYINV